jgi:hypothetical protein
VVTHGDLAHPHALEHGARALGRTRHQEVAITARPAQSLDPTGGDQLALTQDRDSIAQRIDLRQQVAGEQHRGALLVAQLAQQGPELGDALRIEPVGRFVEQQHAPPAEQRLGQAHPLTHPLGEVGGVAPGRVHQPDLFEPQVRLPPSLEPAQPLQARQLHQIASGRPTRLERGRLDQRSDPRQPLGRVAEAVVSVHQDLPGDPRREAQDPTHGRGLARPVVPQEARDCAVGDVQIEPGDGDSPPVAHRQTAHLEPHHPPA